MRFSLRRPSSVAFTVVNGIVGAEQHLVPHAVFLHQHQAVVELERPVVQRADVGVDVRVLADRHHALALVGMAQVGHDDLHLREADRHRVEVPRQRAVQRRLRDERRAGVQQHRQAVLRRRIARAGRAARRRGGSRRTSAAA